MDEQKEVSRNIIDRRSVARHGITAVIAFVLGIFGRGVVPSSAPDAPDHDLVQIVSTALDRGNDFWATHLDPARWRAPHVVLIDSAEQTPCGLADKTSGPFYCPVNERVYVDLGFLRAIHGDLARAYVIGHELGHHIQKLWGELDRPENMLELQADCYAGAWMRDEQTRGLLAEGDIEAAIAEAQAVGDDRLRPGSTPDSWTHGSSQQRAEALQRGLRGESCR